ncbi:MAG: L-2-amino-thiazoline-4-carboxylic acid hydrolase [Candidatus Hermodarchaeota archaeon]
MKNIICTYDKNTKLNYKIYDLIAQCLNGFDRFLKDLNAKIPDSFNVIVENLKDFYEKIENYDVSFKSDFEFLNQYPTLVNGSKNHVLSLVNYSKYNPTSINDEIEIYTSDLVRTFTHFEYFLMESLLKIMTRDEAIEYIKKLSDEISLSRRNPENYVDSFEESTERFKNNLGRWRMQECITGPLNEEKLLYKVKKCEWAEALKKFDSELCYAMLCYSDFQGAQNLNPNFILTRTKTLMMGDDYCDFCYHDTRRDKDLNHPSESKFEGLG